MELSSRTDFAPAWYSTTKKAYAQELSIGYCMVVFSKIFLL